MNTQYEITYNLIVDSVVKNGNKPSNKEIANKLGVSRQRVEWILNRLARDRVLYFKNDRLDLRPIFAKHYSEILKEWRENK